ncbi:uncharacterized protein LOC113678223 [Pocillopora damicornis]|uniref:uncharacterized protein LOC113678223 n=1 Tax=Pocillopora damicornis TaxID=46731 RepID=UPI000F5584C9|nr:uncharacterized protein LOC113678223 [Pocillopora damicornis]
MTLVRRGKWGGISDHFLMRMMNTHDRSGIDALLYGLEQPERRLVIFRGSTVLPRELSDLEKEVLCAVTFPIPDYIKVRGPVALEAYRRALETGKTFDRRTKIVLIGQDRVGKTSLRRYLRGEAFVKDEASTNGIEMISPVKNAGKGAWRNPALLEKTSALDHKCAELVTQELRSSSEERLQRIQGFAGKVKETRGEPTGEKGVTQERSNDDLASKEVIERKGLVNFFVSASPPHFDIFIDLNVRAMWTKERQTPCFADFC